MALIRCAGSSGHNPCLTKQFANKIYMVRNACGCAAFTRIQRQRFAVLCLSSCAGTSWLVLAFHLIFAWGRSVLWLCCGCFADLRLCMQFYACFMQVFFGNCCMCYFEYDKPMAAGPTTAVVRAVYFLMIKLLYTK